ATVHVAGPEVGPEAEIAVVGDRHRLLGVSDPDDRRHGTEGLLPEYGHAPRDPGEDGRLVVVAGPLATLAADHGLGALSDRLLDLPVEVVHEVGPREGPDVDVAPAGVAHGEGGHRRHEATLELVGHAILHDEALGRDAA